MRDSEARFQLASSPLSACFQRPSSCPEGRFYSAKKCLNGAASHPPSLRGTSVPPCHRLSSSQRPSFHFAESYFQFKIDWMEAISGRSQLTHPSRPKYSGFTSKLPAKILKFHILPTRAKKPFEGIYVNRERVLPKIRERCFTQISIKIKKKEFATEKA